MGLLWILIWLLCMNSNDSEFICLMLVVVYAFVVFTLQLKFWNCCEILINSKNLCDWVIQLSLTHCCFCFYRKFLVSKGSFLYLTCLLSYFLLSIGHHFGIIVGESSHQKLSESAKSSQKVDLQGCKTFFFFFLPNFLWESCIIVVKVVYCQQSYCYGFNRTLVIMDSWSCDQNVHFNKLLFIFGSLTA